MDTTGDNALWEDDDGQEEEHEVAHSEDGDEMQLYTGEFGHFYYTPDAETNFMFAVPDEYDWSNNSIQQRPSGHAAIGCRMQAASLNRIGNKINTPQAIYRTSVHEMANIRSIATLQYCSLPAIRTIYG
ncbi:hypothetical protein QE152_g3983 [Popillia japonica]|uniref:Uncharacterized protein n=1 Tax=Popillia japonica TaxID=7064 RepID=A0AAW1N0X6_POPJA